MLSPAAEAAGTWDVEIEVPPGLGAFAAREVRRRFPGRAGRLTDSGRASLRFAFQGSLADLLCLRTAQAAYLVLGFEGRRPTALLGHQGMRRVQRAVDAALGLHPPGAFASFRIGAAGRDSSTFRRLALEIEERTGLRHDPGDGALVVRVRRAAASPAAGWEALVRLSPRPLATRAWRVRDMPGALGGPIAAAMVELTRPRAGDRFLNLLCGSGTLLVERLLRCPAAVAAGCDRSPRALDAARANLEAAGLAAGARLLRADATATGLAAGSFDALCADLPYGSLVGSHRENAALYPALLDEAARIAAPGARFAVITHELRLLDASLAGARDRWHVEHASRVFQGGHHPCVHLLRRR